MTKRYIPVLAAIACLSVAGGPAFATDDPSPAPPQAQPPAATAPTDDAPAATAPAGCVDTKGPNTRVRSSSRGAGRSHMLRGSATDAGCQANSVALVSVSVALKHGKRCQFLTKKGKLSRASSCAKPHFLTAVGTKNWRVNLPRRMKRGTYQILTRAVDSAGNVERAHAQRLAIR
jgi:hypothetical protein